MKQLPETHSFTYNQEPARPRGLGQRRAQPEICREDGAGSRGRLPSGEGGMVPAAPRAGSSGRCGSRGAETHSQPGLPRARHRPLEAGSGPTPPSAPRPAPGRGPPTPRARRRGERERAREEAASRETPGSRGGGRGLTERRGPQDAHAGSAAWAAPPPGAPAPPRRGSGRGGRCLGSSAPGSVAPAPPRARAAAGSASAPAASPSWARSSAGPAAPRAAAGFAPRWPTPRSL